MQTTVEEKRKAVRRRLRDDYAFYAEKTLKIRTKAGKIEPFKLNKAQLYLDGIVEAQRASTGQVRVVILKARQQGLSTYVGGYCYHKTSQGKARKTAVVAHKSDSTKTLFDMTKRFHENMPEIVKPHTKYSSKRELSFDVLDSSYTVATAGGDGIARGETISDLHASELAFWQASTAKVNWNGLRQAVPDEPGTSVFVESTANGITGLFYNLWQGAVAGTNGYAPVFIPWFWDDGYVTTPADDMVHTPDEEALVKEHGLSNSQLAWRRRKIAESGIELFKQEYPATAEEAFLTSGRPVFNSKQLYDRSQVIEEPICRKALVEGETWRWEDDPRGELLCYKEHDTGGQYYIGADVGAGVSRDWSVAQVLDSNGEQVATWRGQVHPDYFGRILNELGLYYNLAFIAVEANNHGILPLHILSKELYYPHLYQEVQHDKITDTETVRLGFTTNVKTKPLIIDQLRAAARDGEITINDKITLEEMKTFIVTESGRMEADDGCFDDTVMSLAIANYINEGETILIENQDNWYAEVI